MGNIAKKFLGMIGFDGDDMDENDYIESPEYSRSSNESYKYDESEMSSGRNNNKVVKIHTTAQLKLVIMQPKSFNEAEDIANHLKSKKPVVMNLESVDKEVARRIVDFLSGAVHALDGNIQKVSNGIFLIAPYNIGIMGDFKDELRSKVFPWG